MRQLRRLLEQEWKCLSIGQKSERLAEIYEYMAADAASKLKQDFRLPKWTSYHRLLEPGPSVESRRRARRYRAIFNRLARDLDKRGISFMTFLRTQFECWRRPKPASYYAGRYKAPAAFPLPQHLIDGEAMGRYRGWKSLHPAGPDEATNLKRGIEWVESHFRDMEGRAREQFGFVRQALFVGVFPAEFVVGTSHFLEGLAAGAFSDLPPKELRRLYEILAVVTEALGTRDPRHSGS
jgi:hypothetical protein